MEILGATEVRKIAEETLRLIVGRGDRVSGMGIIGFLLSFFLQVT